MMNKVFNCKILIIGLYFVPIILLCLFIIKFSVNVPYWDEWALLPFFQRTKLGNINFELFFAQHNEHRMFFPKIIFAIFALLSNWNIKVQLWFSFLISLINFWLIYKISRKTIIENSHLFIFSNILSSFLLFSVIQWENWLWGFQIAWFLIISCMLLAVYFIIAPSNLSLPMRMTISGIFCFMASFSSAHGLLTWLALIPLLISIEGTFTRKINKIIIWVSGFIFSLIIYTINYHKPSHHPDTFLFLKQPILFIQYCLTIIASPLGGNIIIGFLVLSVFIFFNYLFFKDIFKNKNLYTDTTDTNIYRRIAPWLCVGWFSVLFILITAIGRLGFGVEQALASRYTSNTNLLYIACLQICIISLSEFIFLKNKSDAILLGFGFSVGIATSLFFHQSNQAVIAVQGSKLQRNQGQACLELIHYLNLNPEIECLKYIFPEPNFIYNNYQFLEQLNFRQFPKNIKFSDRPLDNNGYIDLPSSNNQIIRQKNSQLSMQGWAIFPNKNKQPDVVLFSYNNKKYFFATTSIYQTRVDVSKHLQSEKYTNSGWAVNLSLNSLPIGDNIIKAWVYDQDAKEFIRLSGEAKIRIVE
jgi:hypothetical protein